MLFGLLDKFPARKNLKCSDNRQGMKEVSNSNYVPHSFLQEPPLEKSSEQLKSKSWTSVVPSIPQCNLPVTSELLVIQY